MLFDPDLAAIRFGCGLSPVIDPPTSVDAMLTALNGPDDMARLYPVQAFDAALGDTDTYRALRAKRQKLRNKSGYDAADEAFRAYRRQKRIDRLQMFSQRLLRYARSSDGLRERLTLFWADHFTAKGRRGAFLHLATPYAETAIRANISGRFEDMLIAAVTNPLMLHYLDQNISAGPNSPAAQRRERVGGLNENLAREVLELHTLGVDGPYSQQDVRQLAELFTGLSYTLKSGFSFKRGLAEPGSEQVLGRSYGALKGDLQPVLQALRDLARHPATARHIARKLAVHFVADQPDPDLVAHVEARFLQTGGYLPDVYAALLEHPAAWQPSLNNVKPPFDFIGSTCRAMAVTPEAITQLTPRQLVRIFSAPMALMGQKWEDAAGPDGWAEEDGYWITPQNLSARLRWALAAPQRLTSALPDPRAFATGGLGRFADGKVLFAAGAAETQAEAIGLVLCAPAFQRR
ncbi:DUF1800 domain-containing protein [Phaeobacter sp. PT47_59]|uniref:DUF1800 domain-containing protein n=1 Tax=Phaeobacter sp. PT47_59 TaxID=3029979 RepID=UPI0023804017|nr:DUF1800 domain-containing protein [Phaeobacter sp. PT47_59]MDE4175605.1 DUF1800 domain-containing protein [Phaeobacter sp. PT47_59]